MTIALALACTAICLRIEQLNSRCHAMPRGWLEDGQWIREPGPWRSSPFIREKWWRELILQHENPEDADFATRPLTADERLRMEEFVRENRIRNELLSFVGSFGLLQYPLVFTLFLVSLAGVFQSGAKRWICGATLIIAILCAWRIGELEYFTSLGS